MRRKTYDLDKIARSLRQETRSALVKEILDYARFVAPPAHGIWMAAHPDALARSHFFSVLTAATHDLRRK